MTALHSILVIAICAAITLLERALPFIIFKGRSVPRPVEYLGKVLPMAIMATLVIYCLKNITFTSASGCLPQLIACAVTAGLYIWKGSTLLSIAGGTIVCMALSQFVFV